jgi:xanthine dehydrogenase molybdopterin-binding subunit B
MLHSQNYRMDDEAHAAFERYLHLRRQQPHFANARSVRNALERARLRQASRVFANPDKVLTADDLKPLKLHWMPTLAGDVAAVLADEKVHFQMQEVAIVIADDRYIAADAVEAVDIAVAAYSSIVYERLLLAFIP